MKRDASIPIVLEAGANRVGSRGPVLSWAARDKRHAPAPSKRFVDSEGTKPRAA
jgi:hypothetical protein